MIALLAILIVTHDMGGSISARLDQMRGMTGARIAGDCFSACTMFLGLPQTCVTPEARLGFHGPHSRSGIPLPRAEWERASRIMAAQYPPEIADWFLRHGRFVTGGIVVISGLQAVKMGARPCL